MTKGICRLLSLFVPLQERKYKQLLADNPLEHDPVFILGHWRSGTTFVHNIFAQDPRFRIHYHLPDRIPALHDGHAGLCKPVMGGHMPNHEAYRQHGAEPRPATGGFWFYPRSMKEYCDRFLTMRQATEEEIADFKEKFMKLVKISMWNSRRGVPDAQYLSKNPPHTGKVKTLVEMFPNAKFIYLIRNPYTVFESSRSFFSQTIEPLELNSIPMEEMEQNILYAYRELYDAYQQQKKYIPEGNLFEVKFEEFEKDALGDN